MRHQIAEASNGIPLTVAVGDEVELTLKENPTSGYRWSVDGLPPTLEPLSDTFAPGQSLGQPGHRTLCWKALRAGQAHVHVSLQRTWGTPAAKAKSIEVILKVH